MRGNNVTQVLDTTLLVFVGHSEDAAAEAQAIVELQPEIQRELDRLLEVLPHATRFTKVKIWEWNCDAGPEVGGQQRVIRPALKSAQIAVFVFKHRVGPVTWDELEECRARVDTPIPILATFPQAPPPPSMMKDPQAVSHWLTLLQRKNELLEGWSEPDSRSLAPLTDYQDPSHLKAIVLEGVRRVLGSLLITDAPASADRAGVRHVRPQDHWRPFIDQLTTITTYAPPLVAEYRSLLRPENRLQLPPALSADEFLTHAGYLREASLTGAGVLLFTHHPESHFPSANTRCTRYFGKSKEAARNRRDFGGPVYQQIAQAVDFVAANVDKLELPVRGAASAFTEYSYPMACVREIIANAVCHRDYRDHERMTYVRVFPKRLEIASPGNWGSRPLSERDEATQLSRLAGESVPPNLRLAQGVAAINIVEVEGSGILTAVRDCSQTGAPEPLVSFRDGYITITIFPRDNWKGDLKRIERQADLVPAEQRPTVFVSYSHKDEKWKDLLLPHLRALELADAVELWDDRRIGAGSSWYDEMTTAIDKAAVAVLLISADYLASDFLTKEEIPYLLARREHEGLVLLPVLLRSCAWQALDWLRDTWMLPRDGRSVLSDFQGREEVVFSEVAEQILSIVREPQDTSAAPAQLRSPRPRRVDIERLPVTGTDLFGRRKELELLDRAWAMGETNVLSLVAWGGVGKSTLVNSWLGRLAADNYRGARYVLGWSFYSQGTGRQSSADAFINAAFRWFDEDPGDLSPWSRGARLAELVSRQRTILVLDGVEPLQSSARIDRGALRDPALKTLLEDLAKENLGLCIVSTRELITDLRELSEPAVIQHDLEHVSQAAGRALLRVAGVRGEDRELEAAVEALGGHALAISLLATYIADTPGRLIRIIQELPEPDLAQGADAHPRRVIEAWARRLGDSPELDVLHQIGLLDRPVSGGELQALRKPPTIQGLSRQLKTGEYEGCLARLRDSRLLAPASANEPDTLDSHPLVRQHFGERLQATQPKAWQAGHNRLFEHLTTTTEYLPNTLEGLTPLYSALVSGCGAGRHQEALDEVYYLRISRQTDGYAVNKLGAISADLAGLASLFEQPWGKPVPTLRAEDQAWLLNQAGIRLRALGRLAEAAEPLSAYLAAMVERKSWANAAVASGNLSELQLGRGEIEDAAALAQKSVEYADRSGRLLQRSSKRATHADALHQAGRIEEAETLFREAERIQAEYQLSTPILYSRRGYRYCELLLGQGKVDEVIERARAAMVIAKRDSHLLDIALGHLYVGEALLRGGDRVKAAPHLQQAVAGLRKAGYTDELPRGLLARARLSLATGDFDRARADLDESLAVCTRIGLLLLGADSWLGFTRFHLARGDGEGARLALGQAGKILLTTGYARRSEESTELEAQLTHMGGGYDD